MRKSTSVLKLLRISVVIASLFCQRGVAQTFVYSVTPQWNSPQQAVTCGLDDKYILQLLDTSRHHSGPSSAVMGFDPGAIDTCGKFALYYEDINSNLQTGFDDTTLVGGIMLGQIRRTTYCQVLSYIQSIFDFSLVSNTDLIKIYVDSSYANAPGHHSPAGTSFYAKCGPFYANLANSYIGGYVNDYIRTGVDDASNYHASIIVNFDEANTLDTTLSVGPTSYQEDTSGPYTGCAIDLFSVLLHETGHGLGWISYVTFLRTEGFINGLNPLPLFSTGTFSKLDSSIFAGTVFPDTILAKLILGVPGDTLYVNPDPSLYTNNNYWLNNLPAPRNHSVFSGDFNPFTNGDTFLVKSFINHLDDNQANYSYREHISPGDRQEYVMGPYGFKGVKRRHYTKGELQAFCNILGYKYIGPDSSVIFGNHPPFSRKMAGYDLYDNYTIFADTIAPDFTMPNNGTSITINLASLVASGDLFDADGDEISVDTNTVTNFRGCGSEAGNNHQLLSFSAGNTVIKYTPRQDFYGRVQFGFNLYDGKEDGSYYVITIDVRQASYPTYTVGSNMVINPGFENGTEMVTATSQTKPNTACDEDGYHEGKWKGASFSDGQPFNLQATQVLPYGSGVAVMNSFLGCGGSISNQTVGTAGMSFPDGNLPLASVGGIGKRYQTFVGTDMFSYYNLLGYARHCHYYTLQFDAYQLAGTSAVPLLLGFKDDTSNYLNPTLDYSFNDSLSGLSNSAWTHVVIPFWYCGADSSHNLLIESIDGYLAIDNLSLTEDTAALPPLIVNITNTPLPDCLTELTANLTNAACNVIYEWSATGLSDTIAAQDTVISNDSATYFVMVYDGCRSAEDSTKIFEIIPGPISGPTSFCAGVNATLTDTVSGGGWTTSDSTIATVDTNTGVVRGIRAGTATITYAFCRDFTTYTVTVDPLPSAITGDLVICLGASTTLIDSVSGGTWTSSSTSVAPIGSLSGLVAGLSTGGALITYWTGPTCFVTNVLAVTPPPLAITGTTLVCASSAITLSDASGGGTWSSNTTSIATVGATTGIVTGVSSGTAAITYTLSTGCTTATVVSVAPVPASISGVLNICPGSTATFMDATGGGTWSSSNIAVATVGATTGVINGITTGSSIITYTAPCGDFVTKFITVNPLPSEITGPSFVCVGAGITLSDSVSGGTWSSSDISLATVDSVYGVVSAVATGTVVISYSLCGGVAVKTLTVNPLVAGPHGSEYIFCIGETGTFYDFTAGGSWSSSSTAVGTISAITGVFTALSVGETSVYYSMPDGCVAPSLVLGVDPTPPHITGPATICTGGTMTLSDSSAYGTWSSGDISVADVGSSTGSVTGVTTGSAVISYTLNDVCYTTTTVAVEPLPSAISGVSHLCVGEVSMLNDSTTGGTWSSSNTAVATVNSSTGEVIGMSTGTTIISYATTCGTSTIIVSVNSLSLPAITGLSAICIGQEVTLHEDSTGGTWSSGSTSIATVSGGGVVFGVALGSTTITYTVASGCYTYTAINVVPLPSAFSVTGGGTYCSGSGLPIGLASSETGVTYILSRGGTAITFVSGTGSAISFGLFTTPGVYTVLAVNVGTGCNSDMTGSATIVAPEGITGILSICAGSNTSLSDGSTGGIWGSSNIAVATIVSSSGIVTGVSEGTAAITYLVGSCTAIATVTVEISPLAISGNSSLCSGATTTLSDGTTSGTWSSSNNAIASIGATSGILTGVSSGTATVTYLLADGCMAEMVDTVHVSPTSITGPSFVCVGSGISLSDATSGGTWSSGDDAIATVTSGTGVVTGVSAGTASITYTVGSCMAIATVSVTASTVDAITGATETCPGSGTTLYDATGGGTWSSSDAAVATVSGSGLVIGISAGMATITYMVAGGCYQTTVVSVHALPPVFSVTGGGTSCVGTGVSVGLTGSTTGVSYTLLLGSTVVASMTGTGSALSFGTMTESGTYRIEAGYIGTDCLLYMDGTAVVNIVRLPQINGSMPVCPGTTISLTDSLSGGTWSSGSTGVATVSSTGVVSGVTGGTAVISYSDSGCIVTTTVTVYPGGNGACSPCSYFSDTFVTIGTSGVISSSLGAGKYYLPNSATVEGALTFTDAVIMIAAGDTLYVDTGASLTLDSSHLFSCSSWGGMELMPGVTTSGRLTIEHATLIEDAVTAVYIPHPVAPSSGLVLDCDNAIFNRNQNGIDITHYNSLNPVYPFLIRNTVFTSRDFQTYNALYPFWWPSPISLKVPYFDGNAYDPPFNIVNPSATAGPYNGVNCKNGQIPWAGVVLDSVGADTSNLDTEIYLEYVALPTYFSDITIGDTTQTAGNDYKNLFDNLVYGINATNSNLSVVNDAFINLDSRIEGGTNGAGSTTVGGDGVYASTPDDMDNHDRLRVWSPGGNPYHNQFYGFTNGVECYNYFDVLGQYTNMINKNTGAVMIIEPGGAGASGQYGYLIKTEKYDKLDISYDTVTNVNNGVAIWSLYTPLVWSIASHPVWQYTGKINVYGNIIQVNPNVHGIATGTQRVQMGIAIQNTLPITWISRDIIASQVNVIDNYLYDVYNGIYISNYLKQVAYTYENAIYLRPNTPTPRAIQYGINNTNCSNNIVNYNDVHSWLGVPAATTMDSLRGYYMSSNSKLTMGCNTAQDIGRGFEFFIQNPMTDWNNNTMDSNRKGFVLNGAVIGPQGAEGTPMGNLWNGTWGSGSGDTQTFVINANPISSPLYMVAGSTTYPSVNYAIPFLDKYSVGAGLMAPTTYISPHLSCYPTITHYPPGALYEQMAQQEVPYDYDILPNNWMGQFKLWEALLRDPSMVDSSGVFYVFDSLAKNSRYAFLTDLEMQLARGDFDSATTMMGYNIDSMANTNIDSVTQVRMADGPSADYIVENYLNFYGLYMKYMQNALASTDSFGIMALAGLCPQENGTVVYQARALYSAIYNDLSVFNDDSCMTIDSSYFGDRQSSPQGGGAMAQNNGGQVYKLFPNPNAGAFILSQMIPDEQPVEVDVWDAVGRNIYKQPITFVTNTNALQMGNISPGVYLLKLTDSKGRNFIFKFTVE